MTQKQQIAQHKQNTGRQSYRLWSLLVRAAMWDANSEFYILHMIIVQCLVTLMWFDVCVSSTFTNVEYYVFVAVEHICFSKLSWEILTFGTNLFVHITYPVVNNGLLYQIGTKREQLLTVYKKTHKSANNRLVN